MLSTVIHNDVETQAEMSSDKRFGQSVALSTVLADPNLCKKWRTDPGHEVLAKSRNLTAMAMAVECQKMFEDLQDEFESVLKDGTVSVEETRARICLKKRRKKRAFCQRLWSEEEAPVTRAQTRRLSQMNAKLGAAFLKDVAGQPLVIPLEDGLLYKVMRAGHGSIHPGLEDRCLVKYTGRLIDCQVQLGPEPCQGGTLFDDAAQDTPQVFPPSLARSFWIQILPLMVRGDLWEVYVPQHLGFAGNDDPDRRPRVVGPNATLVFSVELVALEGIDDDDTRQDL